MVRNGSKLQYIKNKAMQNNIGSFSELYLYHSKNIQLLLRRSILSLILILGTASVGFAEGTKQLEPASENPTLQLALYWLNYNSGGGWRNPFAIPSCGPEYRLNVRIKDPATEKIYYGFRNDDANPLYYQIRDTNNTVVLSWTLVPSTGAGYIATWDEAHNGPDIGAITAGYTPSIYQPLMAGDYYFEFAATSEGGSFSGNNGHLVRFFDISVVQASTTVIDGRVWSKAWQFGDGSMSNCPNTEMFIYADDGIVTKLNINGWNGGHFFINCNPWGAANTGDWVSDRKSFDYGNTTPDDFPQYKEFLNDPDPLIYPTGIFGEICDGGFASIPYCDGTIDFLIKVTKSGSITLHINTPGCVTDLTADSIVGYADCSTWDTIHWDGMTSCGTHIENGASVTVDIQYLNGLTNLPCNDIESSSQGIKVDIIRPIPASGETKLGIMWDDTNIGGMPASLPDYPGCTYPSPPRSGCHYFNDGDTRIINSWWYYLTPGNKTLDITVLSMPATPTVAPSLAAQPGVNPVQICQGQTNAIFTIPTIASADSCVWILPNGDSITTPSNTVSLNFPNITSGGTLKVHGKNATCPLGQNSPELTIIIIPNDLPTISGTTSFCNGTTQTYTTQTSMSNYTWSFSGGGAIVSGGGVNDNFININWNAVGSQSVSVTFTRGNLCTVTIAAPYAVMVNPLPSPTITGPTPVCINSTGNVYTTEALMTGYNWTVSAGGLATAGGTPTDNTITVTWNTAGPQLVSVSYTDADACTSAAATDYPVTVNPLPVPTVTGPASVCNTSTGNIYTTEAGMTAYAWNIPAGGIITGGGATNSVTVTWNTTGAHSINVSYTDANSCTSIIPSVYNVTVNPLPVPVIAGPAAACLNTTQSYSTTALMSAYTWVVSAGGSIQSGGTPADNTIDILWNTTGTQTVSVVYTDINGCTAAVPSIYNITVNPLPVPANSGPASVCLNSTGNIYTTNPGMTGYSWVVSAGGTATAGGGPNNNIVTVQWNTSGIQSVTVNYINGNGCTAATGTAFPVTVHALPVPTITGSADACVTSINNTYTTESGMSGYSWAVSPGGVITAGSTTNSISVTWNTSGNHTVSVNYIDLNSCTAATPSIYNVLIHPLPVPAVTGLPAACVNSTGNPYSTDAGMSAYTWVISAGGMITSGANTAVINVTWNTVGPQWVSVNYTNSNGCRAASAVVKNIIINPLPVPTIAGPNFVCATSAGNIYSSESLKTGYIWSVPGGTITAGAGSSSITVTWNTAGIHPVTVTYDDVNGCRGTSSPFSVTVNALPIPTITGPLTTCESIPGNVYSTVAGMSNYNWTISAGGTITAGQGTNSVTITWDTPGPKTLSVLFTDLNSCAAQIPGFIAVQVNPFPIAIAGPDDYICSDIPTYTFNGSS